MLTCNLWLNIFLQELFSTFLEFRCSTPYTVKHPEFNFDCRKFTYSFLTRIVILEQRMSTQWEGHDTNGQKKKYTISIQRNFLKSFLTPYKFYMIQKEKSFTLIQLRLELSFCCTTSLVHSRPYRELGVLVVNDRYTGTCFLIRDQ